MLASPRAVAVITLALTLGLGATCQARGENRYGPGVTHTEIKLGQTVPYSGPASAFGTIGRAQQAFFDKINAEGGVNRRKIRLISLDDGFNPAKTVEQTRALVEGEQVLAFFSSLGPGTVAVKNYVNQHKVPYLFLGDGAREWDDFRRYPWSIAYLPTFEEGRTFGRYIASSYPKAKVAVLAENGILGDEGLRGLQQALKSGGSPEIAAIATHEMADPTVDSQIFTLQASGADIFVQWSSPKAAAQAIRKLSDIHWRPVHLLSYVSSSIESVLAPAGLERSVGIVTTQFLKQPSDPTWKDDPGVKAYFAWMTKYYPAGDPSDVYNGYGYSVAQTMVHVLRKCGDDLTRENLMRHATSIRDLELPLLLPGIKVNTSASDHRALNQLQLLKFDGARWVPLEVLKP